MTSDQGGVLVVHEAGSSDRLVAVFSIRQLRRGGKYLDVQSRPIHETQSGVEFLAAPGAKAALSSRVGLAEID
jgi:hypothetical protein